jgi:hypothetical protein
MNDHAASPPTEPQPPISEHPHQLTPASNQSPTSPQPLTAATDVTLDHPSRRHTLAGAPPGHLPALDAPPVLGPLLEPHEAADYLGVPTGTLANWRYQGRGPAFVRHGRFVRYRAVDIASWLQQHLASTRAGRPPGRHLHRRRP